MKQTRKAGSGGRVEKRANVVTFEPLSDRSLAGYKAWVLNIGVSIAGDKLKRTMTDAEWEASWRRYWEYRDAPIKGHGGTD